MTYILFGYYRSYRYIDRALIFLRYISAPIQSAPLPSDPLHFTNAPLLSTTRMSFTHKANAFASTIRFPDTPEARHIADMLSAQQQRRHSAHQSLFKSSEPVTEVATPMPSAFKTQPNRTDIGPRKLFDDPSADGSFKSSTIHTFQSVSLLMIQTAPLIR